MTEPIYQPRKPAETYEGKPCRKCNGTTRYVSNKKCIDCVKVYETGSKRKAYRQSPERKIYMKMYEQSSKRKEYREAYEATSERKAYLEVYEQSSKRKEYLEMYRQSPQRKIYMKEYGKIYEKSPRRKAYQQSPKGKAVRQTAMENNRAKRLAAEGFYTSLEWIELKEHFDNRCLRCGRHQSELDRVLEQDHVIPITKGGTNWITNIQPLCRDCNGMGGKGTKTTDYRSTFSERFHSLLR